MPIRPIATGLTLCDLVILDEKTRNVTTANCFSRRVIDGDLAFMPPFFVVVSMVNGHGAMPAKFVIERLDTLEHTYERAFTVTFADTLQELMGIFRVRAHAIPVHGVYHAMLIVDGESIAQKRFSMMPKEAKP